MTINNTSLNMVQRIFQWTLPGVLAAMAGMAGAQPAPAEMLVKGFRGAQFGMTADEVHAVIARDFKPEKDAVTETENPAEGTRVIVLRVPQLDPGPGVANVSYIFGAKARKLMHVNVVWTTRETPSEVQRNEIAAAGVLLNNYLRQQGWKPGKTTGGLAEGPNGVALFIGLDSKNAAVELHMSGVELRDAKGQPGPKPQGLAQLKLSYIANVAKPDVNSIKPGSF